MGILAMHFARLTKERLALHVRASKLLGYREIVGPNQKHVAVTKVFEAALEFRPACVNSRAFLLEDLVAACGLELLELKAEILASAAHSGIAHDGHGCSLSS